MTIQLENWNVLDALNVLRQNLGIAFRDWRYFTTITLLARSLPGA